MNQILNDAIYLIQKHEHHYILRNIICKTSFAWFPLVLSIIDCFCSNRENRIYMNIFLPLACALHHLSSISSTKICIGSWNGYSIVVLFIILMISIHSRSRSRCRKHQIREISCLWGRRLRNWKWYFHLAWNRQSYHLREEILYYRPRRSSDSSLLLSWLFIGCWSFSKQVSPRRLEDSTTHSLWPYVNEPSIASTCVPICMSYSNRSRSQALRRIHQPLVSLAARGLPICRG